MHENKTTFNPVKKILPITTGKNPIAFIEWHRDMSRALGSCQCLLLQNSGGFRPAMHPEILALPDGQALTPEQQILRLAAKAKIDTWNANVYRAIEMVQLSIDPAMHYLAGNLWTLTEEVQHQPDHTFRQIVNKYRTKFVGVAGDQTAIAANRSSMVTKLNGRPPVLTDIDAHFWFIDTENILRQLTALNHPAMNGADLRPLVCAALKGTSFDYDRLQINRIQYPPETFEEIKEIWSHCAINGRGFVTDQLQRPAPLYAVAEAQGAQQEKQLRQLVVQSQGQGRQFQSQAESAAFQRGRESVQSPSDRGREREQYPALPPPPPAQSPGRWVFHAADSTGGGGEREQRPSRVASGGRGSGDRYGAGGGQYGGAGGRGSPRRFGAGGGGQSFAAGGGGGERSLSGGRGEPRQRKFRRVQAVQYDDGTIEYDGPLEYEEEPVEVFGVASEDAEFFDSQTYQPQSLPFQPPYPTQPPPPRSDDFSTGV